MKSLAGLLANVKNGLQHNVTTVTVPKNKLNLRMLCMLLDLGIIENFSPNVNSKYRYTVYLYQANLYKANLDAEKSLNLVSSAITHSKAKATSIFKIYIRAGGNRIMSYHALRKEARKNLTGYYILSTTSGFLTSQEALKKKIGGTLICKIHF